MIIIFKLTNMISEIWKYQIYLQSSGLLLPRGIRLGDITGDCRYVCDSCCLLCRLQERTSDAGGLNFFFSIFFAFKLF